MKTEKVLITRKEEQAGYKPRTLRVALATDNHGNQFVGINIKLLGPRGGTWSEQFVKLSIKELHEISHAVAMEIGRTTAMTEYAKSNQSIPQAGD